MPSILTIDTSTEACSVALNLSGDVTERYEVMPRLHARKLLPMIQDLLSDSEAKLNQLDAIAFTRGPGSFTGLRIAAGAVQGLAFGADVPVIPISTLAALAQGGYRETGCQSIIPALDARMNEMYWGHFEIQGELAVLQGSEQLSLPEALSASIEGSKKTVLGIGQGWGVSNLLSNELYLQLEKILPEFYPRAIDAGVLAEAEFKSGNLFTPEEAIPVYLRGKSAWKKKV